MERIWLVEADEVKRYTLPANSPPESRKFVSKGLS